MTAFGKRLIRSAKEAPAIAKGEMKPARVRTGIDVARIRARLKMSQSEFADLLAVSKRAVQDWEQQRKTPSGTARSLLKVAAREQKAVRRSQRSSSRCGAERFDEAADIGFVLIDAETDAQAVGAAVDDDIPCRKRFVEAGRLVRLEREEAAAAAFVGDHQFARAQRRAARGKLVHE